MSKKTNQDNQIIIEANTRLRDIKNPEDRKRIYKEAREQGKHKQSKAIQAQAHNLKPFNEMSKEEAYEIRRKGAEALNKLKGEKKNALQILNEILPLYADKNALIGNETIPEDIKKEIIDKNIKVTQYHILFLSQLYQAQQGNTKAAEFIANHYGDIVTKEVAITESISPQDKALIEKLSNRMGIKSDIIDTE